MLHTGVGGKPKASVLIGVDNYARLRPRMSLLQGAMVALILYAVAYQLVYLRYELIDIKNSVSSLVN
jgi:hypothetical protein